MVGPARHEKVGLGSMPPTVSMPTSLNIDMTVRAGSSSACCSASSDADHVGHGILLGVCRFVR
jgi:hypothetical protein